MTLEIITNRYINTISWTQASLPLSFGLPIYNFLSVHNPATLADTVLKKFGLNILDKE